MEKMFRMTDGTILATSNKIVIEQFESRPEVYEPITEADLKAEVKPKKENEVKPEAPVEEVAEVKDETKQENQGK
jgi:hypothetical protein